VTIWVEERCLEDQVVDEAMRRIVQQLAPLHARLCPRQVLGARIGLLGGALLGLELPSWDKRLLTIVETNGRFVDGVIVATGCRVGRRTLHVVDHGKVAAVFVDVHTGQAVRVWPRPGARHSASSYAPTAPDPWRAQLDAYQRMPTSELLATGSVELIAPLQALLGRAGVHVECASCSEEVMNDRQVHVGDRVLCRSCVGERYWTATASASVR
jgi:formylmethanofuran dehydrogenase subunit E